MTGPDLAGDDRPAGAAALPRVSVIVPHLNTPEALRRCLRSVVDQQLDNGLAQVIVVDNGSSMPLAPIAAEFPQVGFLAEPVPGPGPARNRGVAAAAAPVLAFIDADCRAAPGWLQAAVSAIEADPQHAIVGGDIRIDFVAENRLTGIEAYEAVFGFRQKLYIERKNFSVTANLAMAAPIHAIVGPFAGIECAEDLDWGQRAHAAGFATRFLPAMRVYHPARPEFGALCAKWRRHIRHDWNAHRAAGRPRWRWVALAAALVASVPLESTRLLSSDRIKGLGNRGRGIGVLARLRLFRAAEMIRVMRAPAQTGNGFWNRPE